jgi:hypothetical protein
LLIKEIHDDGLLHKKVSFNLFQWFQTFLSGIMSAVQKFRSKSYCKEEEGHPVSIFFIQCFSLCQLRGTSKCCVEMLTLLQRLEKFPPNS